MQMRVLNNSTEEFYRLWLGVGGKYDITAFGPLDASEVSAYKDVPSDYYGYGYVDVTLAATMDRLPLIIVPAPEEGGPVFSLDGKYTLTYEQASDGQWQVRFQED